MLSHALVVPGTPGHPGPAGGWGRDPPWGHFFTWRWQGLGRLTPPCRSLVHPAAEGLTQHWLELQIQHRGGRGPPPRGCPFPSPAGSEAGTCIAAVLTLRTPWCPVGPFYLWRALSPWALCPTACWGRLPTSQLWPLGQPDRDLLPPAGPLLLPTPTCSGLGAPAWPQDHRPCMRK